MQRYTRGFRAPFERRRNDFSVHRVDATLRKAESGLLPSRSKGFSVHRTDATLCRSGLIVSVGSSKGFSVHRTDATLALLVKE